MPFVLKTRQWPSAGYVPVAYKTEVNTRLAKPPLNFNGDLAKCGLDSFGNWPQRSLSTPLLT